MLGKRRPDQEQEGSTGLGQRELASNATDVLIDAASDVIVHPAILVDATEVLVGTGGHVTPDLAIVQANAANVLVVSEALGIDLAAFQVHVADLVVRAKLAAVHAAILLTAPQ
jgi:hypothetical protein